METGIIPTGSGLSDIQDDIYELIRSIKDPEHPQSLEDLKVVYEGCVHASLYPDTLPTDIPDSEKRYCVHVEFTPTVPHCSLATLIGLCIRVKLEQNYPGEIFFLISCFRLLVFLQLAGQLKLHIRIKDGTHDSVKEISKQLNDKERVAAAMENPRMKEMVDECLSYSC
ncbi:hypothetical protein RvY_06658 [Ramazzottius varieornatus]|uniref:MIP18 family-like domain-containing protein n=1 Tax=Ramazzottius varieornatus TaxID=947166 RepID=A0A1D1V812_RAMVA|nr:hypothetical protein RvY_06658 [Ramazzottius varieornatus]